MEKPVTNLELVEKLSEDWGYASIKDMLDKVIMDEASPGICVECTVYSTEVAPDSDCGWVRPDALVG